MRHEWNASKYDALPLPHVEWGRRTVARLELSGDEHVLEAGAGTGRDAELVLARIPQGHLTAVDGSSSMLALLRERLAAYGDRVTTVETDLNEPLPVVEPADAIYSVATFHWLPDQDRLFANLAAALRPGGQLVFDCGGAGNVQAVEQAVTELLGPRAALWNFRGIDETRTALTQSGFDVIDVALRPSSVTLRDPAEQIEYLLHVGLGRETDGMSDDERFEFARGVAARLDGNTVDYVRLEASARKR